MKTGEKMYFFISYARDDALKIHYFLDKLTHKGYLFWLDTAIKPGDAWNSILKEKIIQSSGMLLMWTKKSANSKYCKEEWEYALAHNCTVIPVIIDNYPLDDALTHLQWLKLHDDAYITNQDRLIHYKKLGEILSSDLVKKIGKDHPAFNDDVYRFRSFLDTRMTSVLMRDDLTKGFLGIFKRIFSFLELRDMKRSEKVLYEAAHKHRRKAIEAEKGYSLPLRFGNHLMSFEEYQRLNKEFSLEQEQARLAKTAPLQNQNLLYASLIHGMSSSKGVLEYIKNDDDFD